MQRLESTLAKTQPGRVVSPKPDAEATASEISILTPEERAQVVKRARMFAGRELTAQERLKACLDAARLKAGLQKANSYLHSIAEAKEEKPLSPREMWLKACKKAQDLYADGTLRNQFVVDSQVHEIFRLFCCYFTNSPLWQKEGFNPAGNIMLYGEKGTGKSSLIKLFGDNAEKPYKVVTCEEIALEYEKDPAETVKKYGTWGRSLVHKDKKFAWFFDDLGAEPKELAYKMQNDSMQRIFKSLYEKNIPFHFTTNLTAPQVIQHLNDERLGDRMKETINVLWLGGASRRKIWKAE
jgi:hypothetical protein